MNIAITDGLLLMPPSFEQGLAQWSRSDGTPGSATYVGASDAALVTGDQDFGTCLELVKTSDTQKLRFMGETPLLPGCYLRVTARVKAMSGNLPSVRVAGWAGRASRTHLKGVVETGSEVSLTSYGKIVEVSAIVGTGNRGGVDMVWGTGAAYGHFGIDLLGALGGVVRIESVKIEDVTSAFLRQMMDWVDVRDYGAIGDGTTDDRAAFLAADAAADGREILVPAGEYFLGGHTSITNPIRFEGTLTMPLTARLTLQQSYNVPTYAEAFGDENLGFQKALQALFTYSDNNILDLGGRRIEVREPIDFGALLPDIPSFSSRRVIANGQISVLDSPAWDTEVVVSQASYSTNSPKHLSNVANIANIKPGARVEGNGVGREVYVKEVNLGAQQITLSQPLFGGSGTRSYTFSRHKYLFDFSGMQRVDRLQISDVELLLNGRASGVLLSPAGEMFCLRDCFVMRPLDKGITSHGTGCQDILIDRCQFLSNEMNLRAQDRQSIAMNVNANDSKIRDSRFVRFLHTAILNGTGHLIVGNHWFQGDGTTNGVRVAGLVFTKTNVKSAITGNYIDNATIEWTNEYDATPDYGNEYSFGGLTITGNHFTCSNAAPWFSWFVIKPYGSGHFLHGLTIANNAFKALNGKVDKPERVDTTYADLNYGRMRNILISGNMYNGVEKFTANPLEVRLSPSTAAETWVEDLSNELAFGGQARRVESVVAEGPARDGSGARVFDMPYLRLQQGTAKTSLSLNWSKPVTGTVALRVAMDSAN